MRRQNRVSPAGELLSVAARGTLMGNRGVLHDRERRIVRDSQVRRWIACRLEFRNRRREVMRPGSYTELFFLDEATAFAAGHRPCAECRRADYLRFLDAWRAAFPGRGASADAIDTQLHAERRCGPWVKRTFRSPLSDLPVGAMATVDDTYCLVVHTGLLRWSPEGYVCHLRRPMDQDVDVLTPPSIVAVFRAGYEPALHPSAEAFSARTLP
jgi:hypothetical protein